MDTVMRISPKSFVMWIPFIFPGALGVQPFRLNRNHRPTPPADSAQATSSPAH